MTPGAGPEVQPPQRGFVQTGGQEKERREIDREGGGQGHEGWDQRPAGQEFLTRPIGGKTPEEDPAGHGGDGRPGLYQISRPLLLAHVDKDADGQGEEGEEETTGNEAPQDMGGELQVGTAILSLWSPRSTV